jgi:hypothetical protein
LLEDDTERSGSRYLWLSLAAVVIIAVLVYVLFPKQRPKQSVGETPAATPVSQPQEPVGTAEPPVVAQPSKDTLPPPTAKPPDAPKPPVHRPTLDQPPQKLPKKASEYEGMSEKDVPLLLRMAEKDAGAGNYDDAKRKFDIILHLDPGNAEAKQGMRKLELSERETR